MPPSDSRDARIAQLEHDLDSLRALLQEYVEQREVAELDMRASEERLRESEARYRSLIGRAAYGIYRAAPDGRFLDVNPALVAMLGYASAEELLDVSIPRDVYRDVAEREWILSLARDSDLDDWVEVRWKRKDGSPITVRLSVRTVRDEAGEILYCEGIAEDVTTRKRQEELLRRSERMASLGHTLAGVAHELNNPLAAIGGFAQLLLRDAQAEEDRSALVTIRREAERAGRIVKDLLIFARPQEGPQRRRVSVNDVTRHIVATQRYAMETHGIRHELVLDPAPTDVLADATQLEQVVLNLVVNARQAIETLTDVPATCPADDPQPRIVVRTRRDGEMVVLEVADDGPGIPRGQVARIFDPFWTTKDEGMGTGLGLSVVHGIVTALEGTIEVDSEPGAGTRFTVRLPAAADAAATTDAGPEHAAHGADHRTARPLDILLVDDEAATIGFLTRYFTSRGHAVVSAGSRAQALRIAEQSSFDVIVCDVHQGETDGSEVIRRMRAFPTCAGARFVVSASGGVSPATRRQIEELHVAAVIEKPYEVDVLRRAVEEG